MTEPTVGAGAGPGVVRNSLWLLTSQAATTLIGAGVTIYAVRTLAPAEWGAYSTALALVAVFTVFAELGISQLALREMAAEPDRRSAVLANALAADLVTGVAAAALVVPVGVALGYGHRVLVLVAILSPVVVLEPVLSLCQSVFNVERRLVYAAAYQTVRYVIYAALAASLLATATDPEALAVGWSAGAATGLVASAVLLRRRLGVRLRIGRSGVAGFIRSALPIAGIAVVGILYDRIAVLMLSLLATTKDVALYTVPYAWVKLSWVVPSVIASAFFPTLASTLARDRDEARRLFLLVVRAFLFLSLPLSLFLAIASPTLVEGVFGRQYHHAVVVLAILAWTSVLGFENYVLWYAILAIHRERLVLVLQSAGLFANVAANAVLIDRYGARGAAISLLASDLIVVVGQAVIVHRLLFRLPLVQLLAKPALGGAIAIPAAVLLARVEPVLGACVGVLAYTGLLLVLSYISRDEWRPLTAEWRRLRRRAA